MFLPITPPPPSKRTKLSSASSIPIAIRVVQMMDLPPSPISPAGTDITPSVIAKWGETKTAYLMCCLDLQGQLLSELTAELKIYKSKMIFSTVVANT
jgi:hypothetical protein